MAHNLEIVNGNTHMVFRANGGTPWHELGHGIADGMTAEQIQQNPQYGLDFEAILEQAGKEISGVWQPTEGYFDLCRYRNGVLEDVLSVVGRNYNPAQPKQLAKWTDQIANVSDGKAILESAGVLRNGREIWFMMSYGDLVLPYDSSKYKKYLILSTSYDQKSRTNIRTCTTRVVCNNTIMAAFGEAGRVIRRKNTKNNIQELDDAVTNLKKQDNYFEAFETLANTLARTPFNKDQFAKLVEILTPAQPDKKGNIPTRTVNKRDEMISLLDSTPGAMPGTALGALHAITDYTNHYMPVRGHGGDDGLRTMKRAEAYVAQEELQQSALDLIVAATKEQWGTLQLNQIAKDSKSDTPTLDSILAG